MINCEYCEVKARSESGIAMHIRAHHSDKWKGSVKTSFSEGFDIGQREPGTYHKPTQEEAQRSAATRVARMGSAVAKKGQKKAPIFQECPWCDYKSVHPPGLAHHIKKVHPKKWNGRLSVTLGKPMTTSDKYLDKRKAKKLSLGKDPEKLTSRRDRMKANGYVEDPRKYINHCPNCGENLQAYFLAAGAASRHA